MLEAITIKARKEKRRGTSHYFCKKEDLYTPTGNFRGVLTGASFQSHVRGSIQSDSVAEPNRRPPVSVTSSLGSAAFTEHTFQINCISLSVKLGSKLICALLHLMTTAIRHLPFAAANCCRDADPFLSRAAKQFQMDDSIPAAHHWIIYME